MHIFLIVAFIIFIFLLFLISYILVFGFGITVIYELVTKMPYAPVRDEDVKIIFNRLKSIKNLEGQRKTFVDLGSGDGRIIFEAIRRGFDAIGYDLNFVLNIIAFWKAKFKGIKNAKFYRKDFFRLDLSNIDIVFVYLYPNVLAKLEDKFLKELKAGTLVVSVDYPLQKMKQIDFSKEGKYKLFIYEK